MITARQLRAIMPIGAFRVPAYIASLASAMDEFEINTPARQAAFIAQLAHESGEFRYVRELASGEVYDGREDLGNTRPEAIEIATRHGSTPGRWWRGHGLIQITGYDNHRACSEALFNDPDYLLEDPAILEQPGPACRSAAWFWKTHGLNELADAGEFLKITKRINGGTNGLADRQKYYARAQAAFQEA